MEKEIAPEIMGLGVMLVHCYNETFGTSNTEPVALCYYHRRALKQQQDFHNDWPTTGIKWLVEFFAITDRKCEACESCVTRNPGMRVDDKTGAIYFHDR